VGVEGSFVALTVLFLAVDVELETVVLELTEALPPSFTSTVELALV